MHAAIASAAALLFTHSLRYPPLAAPVLAVASARIVRRAHGRPNTRCVARGARANVWRASPGTLGISAIPDIVFFCFLHLSAQVPRRQQQQLTALTVSRLLWEGQPVSVPWQVINAFAFHVHRKGVPIPTRDASAKPTLQLKPSKHATPMPYVESGHRIILRT